MANRSETGPVSGPESGPEMTSGPGPDSGKATGHMIIENERVRVTRWDVVQRGDATGWHRHKHDYVIVPLVEGRLEIDYAGGSDISGLTKGGNDFPYSFVDIELLQPAD